MIQEVQLTIQGVAQGIGLRPRLSQIANQHDLKGICYNTADAVICHWQGAVQSLDKAENELVAYLGLYSHANYSKKLIKTQNPYHSFEIKRSQGHLGNPGILAPDLKTCSLCIAESQDPTNRRYQYPFINCAQCGPRYSITLDVPFDRSQTSMQPFDMCKACLQEYQSPVDRRFHAQTISCWSCGPTLYLSSTKGQQASQWDAITQTIEQLNQGKIIAIKGIGGYHLCCLASDSRAISQLRRLKSRPDQPFAIMVKDLAQAELYCTLCPKERDALVHASAPILVAMAKPQAKISELVSFQMSTMGVMLAYTNLHHLLIAQTGPLVATSANAKGEPIFYQDSDNHQLLNFCDYILWHNRAIVNPEEDSIQRLIANEIRTIRLGRGLAPIQLDVENASPKLGMGGQLKNQVTLFKDSKAIISPFIGDLGSVEALNRQQRHIQKLLDYAPTATVIGDQHPLTNGQAYTPNEQIYHHHAHIFAVIAEYQLTLPVTGFAWDGFGVGKHRRLLGSEAFKVSLDTIEHVATLYPMPLIGGETAFKEPRRIALGLLYTVYGHSFISRLPKHIKDDFTKHELDTFIFMLEHKINCPPCHSMGRLFDGVSYLLHGPSHISYEGQAAIYLEQLAKQSLTQANTLPIKALMNTDVTLDAKTLIDWRPMIDCLCQQREYRGSYDFHNWCAQWVQEIARLSSHTNVVISGGVFQNKLLTELCFEKLAKDGFQVYTNKMVPTNDGGLSLGQCQAHLYFQAQQQKSHICV